MIDGVVKFEAIGRTKKQISVYPLDQYAPGGLKIEAAEAIAAD
jgi:hypothetical protein